MTVVDLAWLVAGSGLGLAAVAKAPGLAFIPTPQVMLALAVGHLGEFAAFAASAMAFGRVARYHRMPKAAEWLSVLVAMATLAMQPGLNVDHLVNVLMATWPGQAVSLDFDGLRWLVGGLFSLAIIGGLGVLRLGRRRFARWAKTLVLAGLALLTLAGPLWVFGFLGDDLVTPGSGFGRGTGPILHRQACVLFGFFPIGLFFGVPAVEALGERIARRPWSWVEWSSLAGPGVVGVSMAMLARGEFSPPSIGWILERSLLLAWFLAVALTSRWILIRFGPTCDRWVEGPPRQVPSSPDPA